MMAGIFSVHLTYLIAFVIAVSESIEPTSFDESTLKLQENDTFIVDYPTFDISIEAVQVVRFSSVVLTCVANGELPMSYKWYDVDSNLVSFDRNQSVYTYSFNNTSWLFIDSFDVIHEGFYTCTASNKHGLSSKLYNVSIDIISRNDSNVTSSIESVKVIEVTDTKVAFNIIVVGTSSGIQARYTEILSANTSEVFWPVGGRYEVTNLQASGNYTFWFKLREDSEYSWSMEVVLLPGVPEVIFRGLNNGQLTIEWFKPFDDIRRETIDKYSLSYNEVSLRDPNDWKSSNCVVSIEIPSSCYGRSYTISDLYKNSYYEIRFRAHTSAGWGPLYRHKVHA